MIEKLPQSVDGAGRLLFEVADNRAKINELIDAVNRIDEEIDRIYSDMNAGLGTKQDKQD